jgi:hypothetical protein
MVLQTKAGVTYIGNLLWFSIIVASTWPILMNFGILDDLDNSAKFGFDRFRAFCLAKS